MEVVGSFKDYSTQVAEKFLQSVVAIDDRMSFSAKRVESDPDILEPDESEGFGVIDVGEATVLELDSESHAFYYQEFSSEFAKRGVVCGGFQPLADFDESLAAIVKSSKNADITILDWQMDADGRDGELAAMSICGLASNDISEGGRLRLLAIYTAEEVHAVAEELCQKLNDKGHEVRRDGHAIIFNNSDIGHWKVEVVSKLTSEEEFVKALVASFSDLTEGLLSNAALAAITDIRNKTHNLLNKFNQKLDSAYLSHVIGLIAHKVSREKAREVALDYAVELISEEIKSELQISDSIKDAFSDGVLGVWPSSVNTAENDSHFNLNYGTKPYSVSFGNESMKAFLSVNCDADYDALVTELDITKSKFDRHIKLEVGESNSQAMLELSAIECSRRSLKSLGEHVPSLKQGVVVKNPSNNTYYVCVQPLCDSVRISEKRMFSFLRIQKVDQDDGKFTHVLPLEDGYLKLMIQPSVKNLVAYEFYTSDSYGAIVAEKSDGKMSFQAGLEFDSPKITFEWCGEFKQLVSQSINNGLASELARVGTDSFEWLRTKSR